jgi:hypothetical protein
MTTKTRYPRRVSVSPQNREPSGTVERADYATRFQPGNNANPGGRPKGLAAKVRELVPPERLAEFYLAIVERNGAKLRSLGIKVSEVSLADRMKAADWLADRGYGKAPIHEAVIGGDPLELTGIDSAIAEVMDELAARRAPAPAPAAAAGELAEPGAAEAASA